LVGNPAAAGKSLGSAGVGDECTTFPGSTIPAYR
jgi:hypothetical protein